MEKTVPELIAAISPKEWAQVPVSVLCLGLFHERETRSERLRKLIEELVQAVNNLRNNYQLLTANWFAASSSLVLAAYNRLSALIYACAEATIMSVFAA
jgi:hypothetical protein